MAIFDWKEEYIVGVAQIDKQHKVLVGMINELHEAMSTGKGKTVLGKILDGMIDYTVSHFATEEKLMTQYAYPTYTVHKMVHDKFTTEALALQKKYRAGETVLTNEVSKFLSNWLKEHILQTDKLLGSFLNKKGVA
jgi:hemerythrin